MGIDPACGDELFLTPEGRRTYTWDSDNLQICGDTEPKLQGNFGFNMDYLGFSLNVTARYQFGGQVYNQTLVDKVENADLDYNVDRRIFTDRWVKQAMSVSIRTLKMKKQPVPLPVLWKMTISL